MGKLNRSIKLLFKMKIFFLIFVIMGYMLSFAEAQEFKIKPGVIITKKNYENYLPELEKHFPPGCFAHYINGLKNGYISIPVIEKRKYLLSKGFREATENNIGKCRVESGNMLLGWAAGMPFSTPKTGAELAWNVYRRPICSDDLEFSAWFLLYNKKSELERKFKWTLWRKQWLGRVDIPPIPEMPGNKGALLVKESMRISEPYDCKGFSMIRIRYEDIKKDDDVYSYIPAIRRIRRLTGADVTDPLLGSDCVPDDFECWRQKINPRMTFKILGTRDFLVSPTYTEKEKPSPSNFVSNGCLQVELEIRPLWILEVAINDPAYAYKRREIYVEKETLSGALYFGENYDQKGRLWRGMFTIINAQNSKSLQYKAGWAGIYKDFLSGHHTIMDNEPKITFPDTPVSEKLFTVKHLIRMTR
jgi:hypothetical protein